MKLCHCEVCRFQARLDRKNGRTSSSGKYEYVGHIIMWRGDLPSSSSLMSLAAWMPSSLRFFSICLLLAMAARSSAEEAHPMMAAATPRPRPSVPSHHTSSLPPPLLSPLTTHHPHPSPRAPRNLGSRPGTHTHNGTVWTRVTHHTSRLDPGSTTGLQI